MKSAADILITSCKLALLSAVIPALLACSGESGESGTVTLSLSELQSQVGYRAAESALTAPTADPDNPAASVALSIVLGPMVVRSRSLADEPYSDRTPITDVAAQLEDDIRNSSHLIVLRNLPTAEVTVEIELPPPGSEKWQLVAAALRTQPASVEDLGEPAHQDAVIYIGFDNRFLGTDSDGNIFALNAEGQRSGAPIGTLSIALRRACLVEPQAPPKGCAQYDVDGSMVVSSAVEVTAVFIDDNTADAANLLLVPTSGRPVIVRSDGTALCDAGIGAVCSPLLATGFFRTLLAGFPNASSVQVNTTHQLGPNASAACQGADKTSRAALESACGVQTYFTPL